MTAIDPHVVRRHRVVAAVAVVVLVSLTGCGDDDAASRPVNTDPTTSLPFAIDAPEGFELITAGRGNSEQHWGSECCGTDEPYTVLSPDGTTAHDDVVIVKRSGRERTDLPFSEKDTRYFAFDAESFTVGGRDALYFPGRAGDEEQHEIWSEVTVSLNDRDLLRVVSPSASRDELSAVAAATSAESDRFEAPTVTDPPGDLQVVGSVDADVPAALGSPVLVDTDQIPAPERSHAIAFQDGENEVVALSLPPDAVDLAALPALYGERDDLVPDVELLEIDGRPAASFSEGYDTGFGRHVVALESGWGDVIMVRSSGPDPLGLAQLGELAASAEPIEVEPWDEFVIEATGGSGLHPDDGRTELSRGERSGIEWLLQTVAEGDGVRADPCLKLSTRERACAAGTGTGATWVEETGPTDGFPGFLVVTTDVEGAELVVTFGGGRTARGDLVVLPGEDRWAAVVFIDPGDAPPGSMALCDPPPGWSEPSMRIDVLDGAGAVVGCVSPMESIVGGS